MSIVGFGFSWTRQVVTEVARAPWTVTRLRESLEVLGQLGPQVAALSDLPEELQALTGALQDNLPALLANVQHLDEAMGELSGDLDSFRVALERTLPELAKLVGGMDDRLQRMEGMVTQLGESILALMGAIPGVRRALRDPRHLPGALPG